MLNIHDRDKSTVMGRMKGDIETLSVIEKLPKMRWGYLGIDFINTHFFFFCTKSLFLPHPTCWCESSTVHAIGGEVLLLMARQSNPQHFWKTTTMILEVIQLLY